MSSPKYAEELADSLLTGVVTGIHYGESFYVRLDTDSSLSGPYGANELAIITDPTPAPRLADVNWSRFVAEAEALAREITAQTPYLTAREAGDCAAQQVEARYTVEIIQAAQPTPYAVAA